MGGGIRILLRLGNGEGEVCWMAKWFRGKIDGTKITRSHPNKTGLDKSMSRLPGNAHRKSYPLQKEV